MSLTADVGESKRRGLARRGAAMGGRPVGTMFLGATYLVALVTLSIGLGLAVPRLTQDLGGLLAWVGAVGVAVGGTAALWCAWQLLHRIRRRWWLLALPAFLVAAYLALWTVGQGVAASFPAHTVLGAATPSDVGLRYESVTLHTADGVDLAGWWVPSKNQAAVVLLPGAGSTRTDVLTHAAVLGSHGYGVLLLDARGHGGSGGLGMDFGWYGERDVSAGLDFLTGQPGVTTGRIGVVGLSLGGEVAIGAAGVDSRVRAVVAEGATSRVADDKGYLTAYGVRGEIQRGIDWATYGVAALLSAAPAPAPLRDSVIDAQADGRTTPMLLITAGNVDTERLAAEFIEKAAPQSVEVWTVPGAGHTGGLRTDRGGWERRVLGFLDTALGPVTMQQ